MAEAAMVAVSMAAVARVVADLVAVDMAMAAAGMVAAAAAVARVAAAALAESAAVSEGTLYPLQHKPRAGKLHQSTSIQKDSRKSPCCRLDFHLVRLVPNQEAETCCRLH